MPGDIERASSYSVGVDGGALGRLSARDATLCDQQRGHGPRLASIALYPRIHTKNMIAGRCIPYFVLGFWQLNGAGAGSISHGRGFPATTKILNFCLKKA